MRVPKSVLRVLIAVVAVGVLLSAIAGGFWLYSKLAPEQAAQKYAAAVDRFLFTKSIRDFPGHLVDNLDESETENFVVYAKGVRRIESGNGANILVSVDADAENCVFEQPDEQITGLKQGDVFFMDPSEQCVSGFAMKVERVVLEDGRAVVEGTAPELRELLEYADVDMDLPLQQIYVEETEIPYTLSWQAPVDEQALWDGQTRQEFTAGLEELDYPAVEDLWEQRGQALTSNSTGTQGTENQTAQPLQNALPDQSAGSQKVAGKGPVVEKPQDGVDESISSQFNLSTRLEYVLGHVHGSGEVGIHVSNIRVTYKFHPWILGLQTAVRMDARPYFDGKFGLRLSGEWVFGMPKVYMPVAGPLSVYCSVNPILQVSGGVYGRMAWAADTSVSADVTQSLFSPIPFASGQMSPLANVASRLALTDVEGQAQLSLLRAAVGFGVPKIGEVGLHCSGGIAADAKIETELGILEDGTMHDCDACVDGDVDWFADLKINAATILGRNYVAATPGDDGWHWTLTEIRGDFPVEKYRKFYVSLRFKGNKPEIECNFGPCPYKGVPYTVQVASPIQNEDIPRSNFVVKAENEDGEVKWELTDEDGIARLMLQQGRYELTVEHGFYKHTEQITVSEDHFGDFTRFNGEETRIDKTVEVDLDPKVFVVLCHDKGGGKGNGNPTQLLNNILGNIPYKLIVVDSPMSEYDMAVPLMSNGATPGDIVVDIWYHEADSNFETGDRWRHSAFILGFYHVNIGRLLYEYNGVDDSGDEQDADARVYWWERSYNNYYGNNTYINGFNFHDDYNRSDDAPPQINGVEQRCEVNLTLTDGPRYDAAYCVVPVEQQLQEQRWYNQPMGDPGFWGLYNQIGSLKNNLVSRARMYSNYVPAMLEHQDFKLLFP